MFSSLVFLLCLFSLIWARAVISNLTAYTLCNSLSVAFWRAISILHEPMTLHFPTQQQ